MAGHPEIFVWVAGDDEGLSRFAYCVSMNMQSVVLGDTARLEDQWAITASAWRGACIEVFARGEHAIADCLNALEAASFALSREARSPITTNRLRALRQCLEEHEFAGHERMARSLLEAWNTAYQERARIAHGTIRATRHGLVIRHRTFAGRSEHREAPLQLSRLEMLVTLVDLDEKQRKLSGQLAQIKRAAANARPANKGADPGSSPG